jgi:lysophospholipase L1-like esterase
MSKFRHIFLLNAIIITPLLAPPLSLYAEELTESNHSPPNNNMYLAEISELLKKKCPHNRTINIVCHGHSVPSGYFVPPTVKSFNSYPHLLHKYLKARFPYAVINVIVTSVAFETSPAGAKRFDRDVLSHRPDVVTIDYALNDRFIGLEKAKRAWISMIEIAKAKGIKVILLTPTGDLTAKLNDPNDPLNQHSEQIRRLAKKYNVGLADNLKAFHQYLKGGGKLKELMCFFNHPNRKGHDIVAKKLLECFPTEMP